MAAMVVDPTSSVPAAKLPTPPYHHSPAAAAAAEEAATPPPKSAGQRSPLSSPLLLSGYSLHDLLLLSPPPSSHRNSSRQRGAGVDESLEMAGTPRRRRRRGAGDQRAAPAGASPRNARRARRRLEKEIEAEENAARRARRRKSTRAPPKAAPAAAADKVAAPVAEKEEDMSLALVPARTDAATHGTYAVGQSGWEGLCERIVELVMWKNVAKSALWFGLGSMFFFSCSFSREITFSPISALCHLGVMILGLAFFKDSVPQRQQVGRGMSFQSTEEDVLRAA